MIRNKNISSLLVFVIILIVLNIVAANFFTRLDLTEDQRYSLSSAAKEIVDDVDSPIIILDQITIRDHHHFSILAVIEMRRFKRLQSITVNRFKTAFQ